MGFRRHISIFLLALACAGDPTREIVVGAAASLSGPLAELTAAFEAETGIPVAPTVAASGQLAHQIRQGAPIAVFLSADVEWVDTLIAEGRLFPDSRAVYARGRLALWSRDTAASFTRIEDLAAPTVLRIAIASPTIAPYGRAARDALVAAGIWSAVEPRLAIAGNVRQALQFAETGNADVALVAHTLVPRDVGRSLLVPDSLHAPLDQALGIVANAADTTAARRFAEFMLHGTGRDILRRHGFQVDLR